MRKSTSKRPAVINSERIKTHKDSFTLENSGAELIPWETSEDNLLNAAIAISRKRSTTESKNVDSGFKINPIYKLAEDRIPLLLLEKESHLTLTVTHAVPEASRNVKVPPRRRKRPGKIHTGVVKHRTNVQMELASVDNIRNNSEIVAPADKDRTFCPQLKINTVNRTQTVSLKRSSAEKVLEESTKKEKEREIFVESDRFQKKVPPAGWERHYDSKGNPFYFHKKSFTSQRVYPTVHDVQTAIRKSKRIQAETKLEQPIRRRKKVQRSKKGNRLIERLNATVWEQRER